MNTPPCPSNAFLAAHIRLLLDSYLRWTGEGLIDYRADDSELARQLWQAPFALLSHGIEADPIFNYGNQTALRLFEYDWQGFTRLPSRLSAEPANQKERAEVLRQVREQGYSSGYRGVRISSTGRRFRIDRATVWNIVDIEGNYLGQAATFSQWFMIEE